MKIRAPADGAVVLGSTCPHCDMGREFPEPAVVVRFVNGDSYCDNCTKQIDVEGNHQTGIVELRAPYTDSIQDNVYLNPLPSKPIEDFNLAWQECGRTDLGNAKRLCLEFGAQFRYTHGIGFMVYDGVRWVPDNVATMERFAQDTVRKMQKLAVQIEDGEQRLKEVKHAMASESNGKLKAMIELAGTNAAVRMRPDDFDRHEFLYTVRNGTLDLRTGELRPHDMSHYITKCTPVEYDADAKCPTFMKFLRDICCEDGDMIEFLQRAVGYTLTGSTAEQSLFFLFGDGANGKTTLLEVLRHLLGEYSASLSFEALLKTRNSDTEKAFAHLPGARYATAAEAGEGRGWNEEAVKSITGGDSIRAKRLYENPFEFKPQAKIWLAANDLPTVTGVNEGIWRRFHMVPFKSDIPKERQDPHLLNKLTAELPGILAWAVRGCMAWQEGGLRPPAAVTELKEQYRSDSDILGRFISEECVLHPEMSTTAKTLLLAFNDWAAQNNERQITVQKLGRRLAKYRAGKLTREKDSTGCIQWRGLCLNEETAKAFHY